MIESRPERGVVCAAPDYADPVRRYLIAGIDLICLMLLAVIIVVVSNLLDTPRVGFVAGADRLRPAVQ